MDLQALPNHKPGERVVLFLRRFWFELAKIALITLVLFGGPIIGIGIFWGSIGPILERPFLGPILTLIASAYLLSVWLFAFFEYTDYYLDTWIVTNERIINIEQHGLFKRVASELHLATIQDVTAEVSGLVHTFFDYGDVYIQTAATKTRFVFKNIAHPEMVKNTIIRLSDEDKVRHGMMNIGEEKTAPKETVL